MTLYLEPKQMPLYRNGKQYWINTSQILSGTRPSTAWVDIKQKTTVHREYIWIPLTDLLKACVFWVSMTHSGWWYTYPSEKYESQLGSWNSQYIWKNKTCLKPPTRIGIQWTHFLPLFADMMVYNQWFWINKLEISYFINLTKGDLGRVAPTVLLTILVPVASQWDRCKLSRSMNANVHRNVHDVYIYIYVVYIYNVHIYIWHITFNTFCVTQYSKKTKTNKENKRIQLICLKIVHHFINNIHLNWGEPSITGQTQISYQACDVSHDIPLYII